MQSIQLIKTMNTKGKEDIANYNLKPFNKEERERLKHDQTYLEYVEKTEDRLKNAFDCFDLNNDRTITDNELSKVLQLLHFDPTKAQIATFMEVIDHNKTGKIEYEEFVFLMYQMDMYKARDPLQLQEDLMRAFKVFDRDDNNFIDSKEFEKVMLNFGDALTKEEVALMMKMADTNEDGRIDYYEFIAMMAQEDDH